MEKSSQIFAENVVTQAISSFKSNCGALYHFPCRPRCR